jgi:DNA repair exonuclease SbcCD ATPase subunit
MVMSFSRATIILRVAALAATLSVTAIEDSPSQPSFTTLSDEIRKAKSLLNSDNVVHQSGVSEPEIETQSSPLRQQQDALESADTQIPQDPSSQQQEFTSWGSPAQSSFFQGAVQEMSNLLASNRKLKHDLNMMQKRDTKEHAGLKKMVVVNSELQAISKQLQGVNKEFEVANVKLQSARNAMQLENTKLQSANEELISKLELFEKQAELAKAEKQAELAKAEEKEHKAEKEVELMASQLGAAQRSMEHTKDMVRKLFPSSTQRRDVSQQRFEENKATK